VAAGGGRERPQQSYHIWAQTCEEKALSCVKIIICSKFLLGSSLSLCARARKRTFFPLPHFPHMNFSVMEWARGEELARPAIPGSHTFPKSHSFTMLNCAYVYRMQPRDRLLYQYPRMSIYAIHTQAEWLWSRQGIRLKFWQHVFRSI